MKTTTRQIMYGALLAIAATGCITASAQTPTPPAPAATPQSGIFPYDQMPVRKSPNGTESRNVLNLVLQTGEAVGVHESMQPAGAPPVALHAIQHSELILVQQGTLTFEHDGKTETAGPGDIIYVAFGTTHRAVNTGPTPARYVVVQIGGDTKK